MTSQAIPLTVGCPDCGSAAIVYSCDPHCCFNPLCADCRASFFHTTRLLPTQAELGAWPVPGGSSDPTAPTAPCDRCGGLEVWSLVDPQDGGAPPEGGLQRGVCATCHALLAVEIAREAP